MGEEYMLQVVEQGILTTYSLYPKNFYFHPANLWFDLRVSEYLFERFRALIY